MLAAILGTARARQPELVRFLASAFGTADDAPFLRPEVVEWKYFLPRPDWSGPRSQLVEEDGRIVAHVGIWPLALLVRGRMTECFHLIDWAAAGSPGAGVLLYKGILERAPTAIVAGGSMGARKLLGRMGLAQAGTVGTYARVIRPWKQLLLRADGLRWKNLAKAVRNAAWGRAPLANYGKWSAEQRPEFPRELDALLAEMPSRDYTPGRRTVDVLNYLMSCPAIDSRAYLLRQEGRLRGYFLLCRAGRQSRIADLHVWGDAEDWASAYSLAARAAAEDPEACEVVANVSAEPMAGALRRSGFQLVGERPLFLFDPKGLLTGAPPLAIQFIESDSYFWYDPAEPFAA